jgi:hypothetical protein
VGRRRRLRGRSTGQTRRPDRRDLRRRAGGHYRHPRRGQGGGLCADRRGGGLHQGRHRALWRVPATGGLGAHRTGLPRTGRGAERRDPRRRAAGARGGGRGRRGAQGGSVLHRRGLQGGPTGSARLRRRGAEHGAGGRAGGLDRRLGRGGAADPRADPRRPRDQQGRLLCLRRQRPRCADQDRRRPDSVPDLSVAGGGRRLSQVRRELRRSPDLGDHRLADRSLRRDDHAARAVRPAWVCSTSRGRSSG